jgi:hypothetical protein
MIGVKYFIAVILFSVITLVASAQPQPPDPQTDPDAAVPITGLEYLLIGGAAYGVARIVKKRKNKNAGM